jgi:hypothetical protein
VKCLNRKHFETSIWLNSDSAFHKVVIAPALIFKCDRIPIAVSGTLWRGSEFTGWLPEQIAFGGTGGNPGKNKRSYVMIRTAIISMIASFVLVGAWTVNLVSYHPTTDLDPLPPIKVESN